MVERITSQSPEIERWLVRLRPDVPWAWHLCQGDSDTSRHAEPFWPTGPGRRPHEILSYDSLLESLHAKDELYVGARMNDHIEIKSRLFAGESIFGWMPSEQLRINPALRQDILNHRADWYHLKGFDTPLLDHALPLVKDA